MSRESIPKKLRDALLDEYDHRCAVCGGDRPHVHHIDEDSSHNELKNLLPLCPNCHLRDQHNPTRKIEIPKLQLFRKYKDPGILRPQFHPIYLRQAFLQSVTQSEDSVRDLERKAEELIELVQSLEMGEFYGKRLSEQIGPLRRVQLMTLSEAPDPRYEQLRREANRDYRQKLIANREATEYLLVELLRYQAWANDG
jgi:hypothetical protein